MSQKAANMRSHKSVDFAQDFMMGKSLDTENSPTPSMQEVAPLSTRKKTLLLGRTGFIRKRYVLAAVLAVPFAFLAYNVHLKLSEDPPRMMSPLRPAEPSTLRHLNSLLMRLSDTYIPDIREHIDGGVSLSPQLQSGAGAADCVGPLVGWLRSTVGHNASTAPETVHAIVGRLMLSDFPQAHSKLGRLWTAPVELGPLLAAMHGCGRANKVLNAFACSADLSGLKLVPPKMKNEGGRQIQPVATEAEVVLEILTYISVLDELVKATMLDLTFSMSLVAHASAAIEREHGAEPFVHFAERGASAETIKAFQDKWQTIQMAMFGLHLARMTAGQVSSSSLPLTLQSMTKEKVAQILILQAAHADLFSPMEGKALTANGNFGLILAANIADTHMAFIPKAWNDAYLAWSMASVAHIHPFKLHGVSELLAPTLMCMESNFILPVSVIFESAFDHIFV
jgi:hypothetical protein